MGNTLNDAQLERLYSVHPHGCGEHKVPLSPQFDIYGSSPRMWGTRNVLQARHNATRFIPTDVGNTRIILLNLKIYSVHPHVCGEHVNY